MLSLRMDDEDARRVDEWAQLLQLDRSTLLRDAISDYLARLAGEHDASAYEQQPMSPEELALAAAEDWGPAEDWSDLAAWLDDRDAQG